MASPAFFYNCSKLRAQVRSLGQIFNFLQFFVTTGSGAESGCGVAALSHHHEGRPGGGLSQPLYQVRANFLKIFLNKFFLRSVSTFLFCFVFMVH
jgi:hypothetical protein